MSSGANYVIAITVWKRYGSQSGESNKIQCTVYDLLVFSIYTVLVVDSG